MFELDGMFELFEEFGDDGVFRGFRILNSECVVVVEHQHRVAGFPYIEHGLADEVRLIRLRRVGVGFTIDFLISTSAPELALAPGDRDDGARAADLILNPVMVAEVSGEGFEVAGLEFANKL